MSHLDEDTLVAVALGEPPTTEQTNHLSRCVDCSHELAALKRTTAALRAGEDQELATPPDAVWASIQTALDDDVHHETGGHDSGAEEDGDLPSIARHRAKTRSGAASTSSRRPTSTWLAIAAAVGIIVGAGATWIARPTSEPPAPADPITQVAAAELGELEGDPLTGEASLVRTSDELDLRVRAEPVDPADGYLEVWLINEDGERMVSVGVLPADAERHTFPISQQLIDQGYVIVDISREAFDDAPEHSGDSVLRGQLEDV